MRPLLILMTLYTANSIIQYMRREHIVLNMSSGDFLATRENIISKSIHAYQQTIFESLSLIRSFLERIFSVFFLFVFCWFASCFVDNFHTTQIPNRPSPNDLGNEKSIVCNLKQKSQYWKLHNTSSFCVQEKFIASDCVQNYPYERQNKMNNSLKCILKMY